LMKSRQFKLWTEWFLFCRCLRAGQNATGFEYYRHGTISLCAAFNTKTGEVIGKTADRHTSEEFVAFLAGVIADNLSAHKTKRVEQFLSHHSNVHLHFTPNYSSWLNQVENWFSKIERDVINRGNFTSVKDLSRKIMTYIRHYNDNAKPMKWSYSDPRFTESNWLLAMSLVQATSESF
jgi:hypothetical protein